MACRGIAVAVFFIALLRAAPSQAQEPELESRTLYWTVTGLEVGVTGVALAGLVAFAIDADSGGDALGPYAGIAPLMLAVSFGFGSEVGDWNGPLGVAIHATIWASLAGLAGGLLAEGGGEDVLGFGPWTLPLFAISGIAAFAASRYGIDSDLEAGLIMLAPAVGAVTGILAHLLLDPPDDATDAEATRFDWSVGIAGFAVPIAASLVFAAIGRE